jgi:NADPH2:quinone reductase
MKAWLLEEYEGAGSMRLLETETPAAGPGQVVVRVAFAALNPADAWLAKRLYPARPKLPHILGRDGAGEVVAAGAGVSSVKPGDMVTILRCEAGVNERGTLAEFVAVPANVVTPVPAGWSLEEAAAAPLVYLTAWQALTQWGPPGTGSVLLVTGASGGVGVASVMLGKSLGMTVVALSRSAGKGARLKDLGADYVFDPADAALSKKVLAALEPRKVDLVVDSVGGAQFNSLLMTLGYGGRVSVVGASGGPVPEFRTPLLLFKRNKIGGVAVGDYTPEAAQEAWAEIVTRLNAMGHRPVIDSVFAFEDVKKAFARLDEGPMGKVLVRIRQ